MNSRVSWIAALSVGFGVAIAIKSFWLRDTDRTAADLLTSPEVGGEGRHGTEQADEASGGELSQVPAPADVVEPVVPSGARTSVLLDPGFFQTARQFESESKDPTWSGAADAHILGRLSRMTYLKAVYVEVDCRTTMCRIQIAPLHYPPPQWELGEMVYKLGLSPWQFLGDRLTMLTYLQRDRVIWVEPPNATVAE